MEALIAQYDIVTSEYADMVRTPIPTGKAYTVRQFWDAHDGVFFEKSPIDLLFELIDQMAEDAAA